MAVADMLGFEVYAGFLILEELPTSLDLDFSFDTSEAELRDFDAGLSSLPFLADDDGALAIVTGMLLDVEDVKDGRGV